MTYEVISDLGGKWYVVSGYGHRVGPLPTRAEAEEVAREMTVAASNRDRDRDRVRPADPASAGALCVILVGATLAAGVLLGFVGAVAWLTFRWVTGAA